MTDGNGEPVPNGNFKETDHTGAERAVKERVGDRYELIQGDRGARVRVSVGETLGGPSYSSVRVQVDVSLMCNQDERTVAEVRDMLFAEAAESLDKYVEPLYELLLEHNLRLDRRPE